MAKKKSTTKKADSKPAAASPTTQPPPGPPGGYPGYPPAPGGQATPAAMPAPAVGAPPAGAVNPQQMMMQMMQMMMAGGAAVPALPPAGYGAMPGYGAPVDPSAVPFGQGYGVVPGAAVVEEIEEDEDEGLDEDIIRPARLENRIKQQEPIETKSVLDDLCLTEDGQHALGGIPKGCTIAFVGPPGYGKTRTALAMLCLRAQAGDKVAYVVAEEGFHDDAGSGRDDLCSRLCKIGMAATGIDTEAAFEADVLGNVYVLQSQYHRGQTWDDFVTKYRYLVERASIRFVVIDSLNMLDPSRARTADNLSALKTYNHENGITCVCVGQIKDTGDPVGGEALQHTADAVFLLEEMSLTSKDMAEEWGGKYRDKIGVIRAVKSVTTPIFPHAVRIDRSPAGTLIPHEAQPEAYALLPRA